MKQKLLFALALFMASISPSQLKAEDDLITVSLPEPGSLGTEVLYNVDNVKDVKNLKVIGKMNEEDWAVIGVLENMTQLDLSEAVTNLVPEDGFTKCTALSSVTLPEGVATIGKNAFYNVPLETINFPSTLTSIGEYAFYKTKLTSAILPNSVKTMGSYCFCCCESLTDVTLSSSMETIPSYAFYECSVLKKCIIPEGIKEIRSNAFYNCHQLCNEDEGGLVIPSTVKSVGYMAFYYCTNLTKVILKGVSEFGGYSFFYCTSLQEVELPTTYFSISQNYPDFSSCPITKLTLKSPTVINHLNNGYETTLGCDLRNVDLYVPDFLVNQYKLDTYWYQCKSITGFSSEDISYWEVNTPWTLDAHGQILGTPDITIKGDETRLPSMKIYGDKAMTINNLFFGGYKQYYEYDHYSYRRYNNYPGQMLSNNRNISVTGDVTVELMTNKGSWFFFSLPFDVKVSEITHDIEGVQMAIRYYDGANRAENGPTGSWKNYEEDAVIPAGTGFIVQTNVGAKNYFHAMGNASKQNCVSNKDFVKTLEVNDSETESNKGWNLVGNPWQCYFNDHSLNFTAPITVWDEENQTYIAYSITDDDYAIRPNEAFFVQCPGEDYPTIGFPVQGRQLNDVIETQNAVKAFAPQAAARKPVNLTLTNGEQKDQTRVVLNEKASLGYETICDASKFLSMDASVPQLYSLDMDGTQYAINERPMSEGSVKLGFMAPADGSYTIALGRCDLENVYLKDNKTNETIALTEDGYTFEAEAGVDDERFTLCFNAGEATGIEKTEMTDEGDKAVYSIDGKYVGTEPKKLDNGVYIIRKGKNTSKVVVR